MKVRYPAAREKSVCLLCYEVPISFADKGLGALEPEPHGEAERDR